MLKEASQQNQSSNFNRKNEFVALMGKRQSEFAQHSLRDLEALRVSSQFVSASKNGLELICGASCETGAQ